MIERFLRTFFKKTVEHLEWHGEVNLASCILDDEHKTIWEDESGEYELTGKRK